MQETRRILQGIAGVGPRSRRASRVIALALGLSLLLAGCATAGIQLSPTAPSSGTPGLAVALPHVDHIVVVVEENHSYDDIMGSDQAPYIQSLAGQAAIFTDAHAVTHPSQPNYLALYAGSTLGVASDDCPQEFSAPNLGADALAHGLTFTGYSESLPQPGYSGCAAGDPFDQAYVRKHNPWSDFADVPGSSNQPFASFPQDFTQLPAIAFVVPNEQDDMHSGSVAAGDNWLQHNLDAYVRWAPTHDSLLILTWDEDDGSPANHILTLFAGAHLHPGQYGETITHYDVLRTIEALDGLPFTGSAASGRTISDVWQG